MSTILRRSFRQLRPLRVRQHVNTFGRQQACLFHRSASRFEKKRDHYEVLGVGKSADKAEIKKKYYQLAKKYHPDQNAGNEAAEKKFQEISNAYETLSNPEKRQAYDQFGHDAEQMGGFGGGGGEAGGYASAEDMFRDIFGGGMGGGGGQGMGGNPFADMFGGGGGGQRRSSRSPQRGSDMQTTVRISFMDAVKGCERNLDVTSNSHCSTCKGSGQKEKTTPKTCATCGGTGVVVQSQGFFQVQMPCPNCHGEGQTIEKCSACNGHGLVRDRRKVKVKIPAGVDENTKVRMVHQGDAGPFGGPRGHLWLKIQIEKHEVFRREGSHVHMDVPITLSTAVLGGVIEIPTLVDGTVSLKVDKGTQPHETRRLRGKGIKKVNSKEMGDQYLHFKVNIPTKLTKKQEELMLEFQKEEDEHHPKPKTVKGKKSFFGRVKEFISGDGCEEDSPKASKKTNK